MITMESVCTSIKEIQAQPMTAENVHIFADLLFIKDRMSCAPGQEDNLTPEAAEKWVKGMENADGTKGPHWSMEKTEELRKVYGIEEEPLPFWVTMNMMYSDYCIVAEKLGTNNAQFYVCMSKAFLGDKDAQPDKLARYYKYIVCH